MEVRTVLVSSAIAAIFSLLLYAPPAAGQHDVGYAFGEEKLYSFSGLLPPKGDGAQGVRSTVTVWDMSTVVATDGRGVSVLDAYLGTAARISDDYKMPKHGAFIGYTTGVRTIPGRAVPFVWYQHSDDPDLNNTLHTLSSKHIVASPGLEGVSAMQYEIEAKAVSWQIAPSGWFAGYCVFPMMHWVGALKSTVADKQITEEHHKFFWECNLINPFNPRDLGEPDHFGAEVVGAGGGTNRDPKLGWYFGDFTSNEWLDSSVDPSWEAFAAETDVVSGSHHRLYKPTGQSGWGSWGVCGHDEGRYASPGTCPPSGTTGP